MPTKLPPRRKRSWPQTEEGNEDTLLPAMLIVTLLAVNIGLFCWKFGPPSDEAVEASALQMQMSP